MIHGELQFGSERRPQSRIAMSGGPSLNCEAESERGGDFQAAPRKRSMTT